MGAKIGWAGRALGCVCVCVLGLWAWAWARGNGAQYGSRSGGGGARGPPTRECAGLERYLYGTFLTFFFLFFFGYERCCRLD